jgi:hypothetical protein
MAATLYLSIVTSALGMAYIVYGRRQAKMVLVVAGLALCLYTYFIDGWLWLCIVGAVLLLAPFIIDVE